MDFFFFLIIFYCCHETEGKLKFQIIRILPERHPSRPYTVELERRFKDVEGVFVQSHPAEVRPVHLYIRQ